MRKQIVTLGLAIAIGAAAIAVADAAPPTTKARKPAHWK